MTEISTAGMNRKQNGEVLRAQGAIVKVAALKR